MSFNRAKILKGILKASKLKTVITDFLFPRLAAKLPAKYFLIPGCKIMTKSLLNSSANSKQSII